MATPKPKPVSDDARAEYEASVAFAKSEVAKFIEEETKNAAICDCGMGDFCFHICSLAVLDGTATPEQRAWVMLNSRRDGRVLSRVTKAVRWAMSDDAMVAIAGAGQLAGFLVQEQEEAVKAGSEEALAVKAEINEMRVALGLPPASGLTRKGGSNTGH